MMYAVIFEDRDELAHMRQDHMTAHMAFLRASAAIKSAGPLTDAVTGGPEGGLWLVEAGSVGEVEALVRTDPFWPTGLRKSMRILEWKQVHSTLG